VTEWRPTLRSALCVVIVAVVAILQPAISLAFITQGDLTVYSFFETREAGRWGEGGSRDNGASLTKPGKIQKAATESGGSFDFKRWDLVEMRQVVSVRPDYHFVKNYKLLGRIDTRILKDANFYMYYRAWYDAEGTLKSKGRVEAFRDYTDYTQHELQQQYFRNELHEYYADLNFTDNFTMRVGKQQIIWSEANLLSGTEITNPGDVSFHGFVGAEAAEDVRKGLDMVKFDYLLDDLIGDVLRTSNNEVEGFWIPGDFEGASGLKSNISVGLTDVTTDPRNPYAVPVSLSGPFSAAAVQIHFVNFNQDGQRVRVTSLLDLPEKPMVLLSQNPPPVFADFVTKDVSRFTSKSIDNSEFGGRFSTILPLGDGLQTSFIFLYEARNPKSSICTECPTPPGFLHFGLFPGAFLAKGRFPYGKPHHGVNKIGELLYLTSTDYRRNPYFGITGTFYDKEFTDSVFHYDLLYAPRVGISAPTAPINSSQHGGSFARWTELSRFILSADRPTLIPLLYPYFTKQHTTLSFQAAETFYPDLPAGAIPNDSQGKIRRWSTFLTMTGTNFFLNGRIANLTGASWDADDQTGQFVSNNVYRYSRNVLFGVNVDWYLGRSGRHTDPYLQSKSQRINELEFTLTYEL